MELKAHIVLRMTGVEFLENKFFAEKKKKNRKNRPKIRIFEFIGKFRYCYFLNLIYKERLYILLYCCANIILGKNVVSKISAKMFSANQIEEFLNQLYL